MESHGSLRTFSIVLISLTWPLFRTLVTSPPPCSKKLWIFIHTLHHTRPPPGVLTGLILGNYHRIFSLCSCKNDDSRHLQNFYLRLTHRGYQSKALDPLFKRPREIASTRHRHTTTVDNPDERIFFYIRYNPRDPPSTALQRSFYCNIMYPPFEQNLTTLVNLDKEPIPIQRMTVAYRRPLNLGNLFSYRNMKRAAGCTVSYFVIAARRDHERERENFLFPFLCVRGVCL